MTLTPFRGFFRLIIFSLALVSLAGCLVTQSQYRQTNIEDTLAELERVARQCGATDDQIQAAIGSIFYTGTREDGTKFKILDKDFRFSDAWSFASRYAGPYDRTRKEEADRTGRAAAYVAGATWELEKMKLKQTRASEAADRLERAKAALQASKKAAIKAAEAALAAQQLRGPAQQHQGTVGGARQRMEAEIRAITAGADPDIAKAAAAAAINPNTYAAAKQVALDRGYSEDKARAVANAISVGLDLADAVEAANLAEAMEVVRALEAALINAQSAAYQAAALGPNITEEQAGAMARAMIERIKLLMDPNGLLNQVPPVSRGDSIDSAGIEAAREAGAEVTRATGARISAIAGRARAAAMTVLKDAGFDVRSGAGWPVEAWQNVQEARRVATAAAVSEGVDEDDAYALAQDAVNAKVDAYRQAEANATEAALSAMRQRVQNTLDINRRAALAAADAYAQALREGKSADEAKTAADDAAKAAGAAGDIASDIARALKTQVGKDPSLAQAETVAIKATPDWDRDDEDWARWEERARPEAEAYGRAAALGAAAYGADIERERVDPDTQEGENIAAEVHTNLRLLRNAAQAAFDVWDKVDQGPGTNDPQTYHRGGYYRYNILADLSIEMGDALIDGTYHLKEVAYKLLQESERKRDLYEQWAIRAAQEANEFARSAEARVNEHLEKARQACGLSGSDLGLTMVVRNTVASNIAALNQVEVEATFNIEVNILNEGPYPAQNISATVTLPGGATLASDWETVVQALGLGGGWSCTQTSGQVDCTLARLLRVGKAPPLIVSLVAPSAPQQGVLTTAIVYGATDGLQGNNRTGAYINFIAPLPPQAITAIEPEPGPQKAPPDIPQMPSPGVLGEKVDEEQEPPDGLPGLPIDGWNASVEMDQVFNQRDVNFFDPTDPTGKSLRGAQITALQVTLTVIVAGVGEGTVTSDPAGINCTDVGGTCEATFNRGEPVTLTPVPGGIFEFSRWGIGDCDVDNGEDGCDVNMNNDRTVNAFFE
jgi:hypothetical protein